MLIVHFSFHGMHFVYIIQSQRNGRYYYGFTQREIEERVEAHNHGDTPFTRKYKPWILVWYAAFASEEKARSFEKYLKTGSGHAFSRKRLI